MIKYLLLLIILIAPTRVQDRNGYTSGYFRQVGPRTYYYDKHGYRTDSFMRRGRTITTQDKNGRSR